MRSETNGMRTGKRTVTSCWLKKKRAVLIKSEGKTQSNAIFFPFFVIKIRENTMPMGYVCDLPFICLHNFSWIWFDYTFTRVDFIVKRTTCHYSIHLMCFGHFQMKHNETIFSLSLFPSTMTSKIFYRMEMLNGESSEMCHFKWQIFHIYWKLKYIHNNNKNMVCCWNSSIEERMKRKKRTWIVMVKNI